MTTQRSDRAPARVRRAGRANPVWRYLSEAEVPYLRLASFFLLVALQFLAVVPFPFLVKAVFDTAIEDKRGALLFALAGLMLVLQALALAAGLLAANTMLGISTDVVRCLRRDLFDKLYGVSIRFHQTSSVGDLHDRVVQETERIDLMTRNGLGVGGPSLVISVGILCILAFINWVLFLTTLAVVPLFFVVNRASRRRLRKSSRAYHRSIEALSERVLITLRMMRETRVVGAEDHELGQSGDTLQTAASVSKNHGMARAVHQSANQLVTAVWVVLVLTVGGWSVIEGRISLGELFAFYAGLALLRQPLDRVLQAVPLMVSGREALKRVFELLDVDDLRPYTGKQHVTIERRITVEHVSFSYQDTHAVLGDASLELQSGHVTALMGANGSGKTTLASLIAGFHRPSAGRLAVDDVAYDHVDVQHLRRQFGVLAQDPAMIPGTVRDNVSYGRPQLSDADIDVAIELAGATAMIRGLKDGLDTPAFENGPLLSGGQLQRIGLARALVGGPRVLVLDEPTNHLDADGLRDVLAGLQRLEHAPAILLITHSAEVAMMADSTYMMDDGRPRRLSRSQLDSHSQ